MARTAAADAHAVPAAAMAASMLHRSLCRLPARAVPGQGAAGMGVAAIAAPVAKTADVATAKSAQNGAATLPTRRPAWLVPELQPLAECGELPLLEG